ncbi:MAG: hypothetical protein OXI08_03455, partial [Cyanobacteria bacterium MAG IRC4_bin_6]|nr:hypothetical protein [Cyanobacteria bacterium MAG IRC3_bin_20]MDE0647108.1 hypothetical protein [Cyanobacteria bacterium MAG IRC4_bin_6]
PAKAMDQPLRRPGAKAPRSVADMDLLFNDLSIHGQFHDVDSFHKSLERLMKMRAIAKRFGREVYCNSNLVNTSPGQRLQMQKAIHQLSDDNKRRLVMRWLTNGPFWDAPGERKHSGDNLLECVNENDQVVTDTAVGEAAFRVFHGSLCGVVSIRPSDWEEFPLIKVAYRDGNGQSGGQLVNIDNFLDPSTLEISLQDAEPPVDSWNALKKTALQRFDRLTFAQDCFESLTNLPFVQSSANTLIARLHVLSQLADARDQNRVQSGEEQRIYNEHFTGKNAWFSDSSNTEKQRFKKKLTFPHPEHPGQEIFCPYHGKEQHLTLRLHVSWPIQPGQPVYVVYIGPKLTKT